MRNDFRSVAPGEADRCDDIPWIMCILRMGPMSSSVNARDTVRHLPSRSAAGYSDLSWSNWASAVASKASWSDIDMGGAEGSNVECASDLLAIESGHVVRCINIIFKNIRQQFNLNSSKL